MMKNKANGTSDCWVTEMLRELPMESLHEITNWFDKRSRGECRAPATWKVSRLVFLQMPDAKKEKGLR